MRTAPWKHQTPADVACTRACGKQYSTLTKIMSLYRFRCYYHPIHSSYCAYMIHTHAPSACIASLRFPFSDRLVSEHFMFHPLLLKSRFNCYAYISKRVYSTVNP
jgi:hypothetical protein